MGCLLVAALLGARAAAAEEVVVPLRIDLAFVREQLVAQLFPEAGERASVWRDGTGCGWLVLAEPVVDVAGGRLRIVSSGDAQVGTPLGGERCLKVLAWTGFVEAFLEPGIDPVAPAITFRVVDSNVYDAERKKGLTTGRLWDLVKDHAHPRLGSFRIDVSRPFTELREWLPLVLPGSAARIDQLLASLELREPRAEADAIAVALAFDVEPPSAPPAPEEPLTPEELDRWDAFLTFVTKAVGRQTSGATRRAVMDVLLDGRHDIVEALGTETPPEADPVPGLFLRAWEALAPAVRTSARGQPAETALRYLSFLTAGDALAALVRLGPRVGLDVSADGLRRLARMVDPVSPDDPLRYGEEVDPELRALFGLGAAPPPPDISPDVELDPLAWLVAPAYAALGRADLARLNRWIPERHDLHSYLRLVRELLLQVREEALGTTTLEEAYRPMYRHLVLATAWQESCWRQFVRRGGRAVPLRSPVGSVGIMQVNQRVWRGVYEQKGLLGDIAYNARAGAEILLRYLRDYGLARGEHRTSGGTETLVRVTYATYNGGPRQLARYRSNPSRAVRRVVEAFAEKYRAVTQGKELEVASCWGW
jgi:hypothetical protein